MIVFNYPETCPNKECRSPNIKPIDVNLEELPADVREKATLPESQIFLCKACSAVWVERLVRSCDVPCYVLVESNNWSSPLGILSNNPMVVKKLFGVVEGMEYSVKRIETILDDGERRVQLVQFDPKAAKEAWLPGPDWTPPAGSLIVPK